MLRRLILLLLFASALAWPADLSGSWNFKATSQQGEHAARLTLAQDGEKITGTLDTDRGEFKIEGTLKGDQIRFSVQYTGADAPRQVPFSGKLEGDRMSGQYQAGENTGNWSAERSR